MPNSVVPCAVAAAKHNVQALLQERRQTFWAAHATQRAVIAFLVRTNNTIRSVVDVGAAEYLYGRGTTADESSLHNTFRQLGNHAHYYGFDPGLRDIRGLQRAAKRDARVPRGHAHFYPLALAGMPGRTRLLGEPTWRRVKNGTTSSWQPRWSMRSSPKTRTTSQRLEGLHQYRHVGWVNATTLDLFAIRESLPGIDFIKVDTEGTEREVLLEGAAELLRSRRVRTILWEYGDTISADTFLAAKSPTFVPPPSPDAMHGPNLKRVTAALLALGYRCLSSVGPLIWLTSNLHFPPPADPQELLCGCLGVGPAGFHTFVGGVLGRRYGGVSATDGQDLLARHPEHSCRQCRGRSDPRIARAHGLGEVRGRVQRPDELRPPSHVWAQRFSQAAFLPDLDALWQPDFRHRVLCEHFVGGCQNLVRLTCAAEGRDPPGEVDTKLTHVLGSNRLTCPEGQMEMRDGRAPNAKANLLP